MSGSSAIEWTDATWNPVTGCDRVSPGCAHCYALDLAARLKAMGQPRYQNDGGATSGPGFALTLHPDKLGEPLRWRKPRMVFVNSMSDLFHEDVPDEYILRVFTVMRHAEQHTFQVLTKRPERMRDLVSAIAWRTPSTAERHDDSLPTWQRSGWQAYLNPGQGRKASRVLPNVWLGTSIENRRFVGRADHLRATPAAVRFISAEPLIGPLLPDADHLVDSEHETYPIGDAPFHAWREWADGYDGPGLNLEEIDWLIVGGESGTTHRPIRAEWVRELRESCAERCWQGPREGTTAFFFKQWGGRTPKSGGRELDGRTWDEFPVATPAPAPDPHAPILQALKVAWDQHPDQRLGQLIVNAVAADPFFVEDRELVGLLAEYVETVTVRSVPSPRRCLCESTPREQR